MADSSEDLSKNRRPQLVYKMFPQTQNESLWVKCKMVGQFETSPLSLPPKEESGARGQL